MNSELIQNSDYKRWLTEIKKTFLQTQLKAAVKVNSTLLEFYWRLGSEIVEKQKNSAWVSISKIFEVNFRIFNHNN